MGKTLSLVGLTALIAMSPAALQAQTRAVSVGDMIRVSLPTSSRPTEGILTSASTEEWTLSLNGDAISRIDPSQVISLEVQTSRRHTLQGLAIGAGGGLVLGLVANSGDSCSGSSGVGESLCEGLDSTLSSAVLVYAAAIGAGVGALLGTMVTSTQWVPGSIPSMQPRIGVGVAWAIPASW